MTEVEWQQSDDVYKMLWLLKGNDSNRKMRLFGCACCRCVWDRLTDPRYQSAVETAEQFVEGNASDVDRETARQAATAAMFDAQIAAQNDPAWALKGEFIKVLVAEHVSASQFAWLFNEKVQGVNPLGNPSDRANQADILRDLFGSMLFHDVTVDPNWLTSTVVELAQSIYAAQVFDQLPILADALEEAGCANADILAHCRSPGLHVRGCWVVDLILGEK